MHEAKGFWRVSSQWKSRCRNIIYFFSHFAFICTISYGCDHVVRHTVYNIWTRIYDVSGECGAFHDLYNTVIIGDHIPSYTLHNHIMALGAYDH